MSDVFRPIKMGKHVNWKYCIITFIKWQMTLMCEHKYLATFYWILNNTQKKNKYLLPWDVYGHTSYTVCYYEIHGQRR